MIVQRKSDPLDGGAGVLLQLVDDVGIAAVRGAELLDKINLAILSAVP